MKKRNKGLVLLVLAVSMLLSSCLKDDPQVGTIVLMGTESYVKSIEEVIPEALLDVMDELPEGNMPPDVQGEFVLFPKELLWTNAYPIATGDSVFFRFGGEVDEGCYLVGQHNRVVPLDYKEEDMLMQTDTAFLMGEGNAFVAYFELTQKHIKDIPGVDFDLKRGYVMKGEMSRSGDAIQDVCLAYINLELSVNDNDITISGVTDEIIKEMEGCIYLFHAQNDAPMVRYPWF